MVEPVQQCRVVDPSQLGHEVVSARGPCAFFAGPRLPAPVRGRMGTAGAGSAQPHEAATVAAWPPGPRPGLLAAPLVVNWTIREMMLSKSGSFGHGPVFGPVVGENPCFSEEFEGWPGAFNP